MADPSHDHFKIVYACGHIHSECNHRGAKFAQHLDRSCPDCKDKPPVWIGTDRNK